MNYIFIKIYDYILLNKFLVFFKLKSNQKNFNNLRDFTKVKYEEENSNLYSRIILDPNFYDKKNTDNKNKFDYTLNWLFLAKSRGGINLIKRTRNHIMNWKKYFYNDTAAWEIEIVAQRLNSLISNYDFYALNAEKNTKTIFQILILKNYLILSFLFKFQKNKNEINIKIIKTFLQLNFIFNIKNISKILFLIDNQLSKQINSDGFHRSMDPVTQAEFINCLYEINDMLLFFGLEKNKKIIKTINEMQSVLQNMFHRDGSIPLFNGANNSYKKFLHKVVSLAGDIKNKELSLVNNGLISLDIKKMKVFFDVTKPDNKNINKNLHSGTLGFEMSYEDEKIITNCGSVKDSIKKNQIFLRYSAAHSTIIINNTNISELSLKNSFKRIPKNVDYKFSENIDDYLLYGLHDGYRENYNILVKRILKIRKKENLILGQDEILKIKNDNKKYFFDIRFHITPNCNCVIANNAKSIIIKSSKGQVWLLKIENSISKIEESINIVEGRKPLKTKQIVIYGNNNLHKAFIKWSLKKIN